MTDAHHWIQRGHGLLKDHREGTAAVRAHLIFTEGEEIFGVVWLVWLAGELKIAGDGRGGWKEPEQSERRRRLAGAGLADEADGLAGCDVEGDAVDGLVPGEGDPEIARGEQWGR